MVDPHARGVFVRTKNKPFTLRTVVSLSADGDYVNIVHSPGRDPYRNRRENVRVVAAAHHHRVTTAERVEVDGERIDNATAIVAFDTPGLGERWLRVFHTDPGGSSRHLDRVGSRVTVQTDASASAGGASLMDYWHRVVNALKADDPLRRPYRTFSFVSSASVLGRMIEGAEIDRRDWNDPLIFPFGCNLSQRKAVENALRHSVSVIEGPPGTGKTQTILNVIANIVAFAPNATIGVVSSNNAAVENVGTKLDSAGIGFIAASLGNKAKRAEFLAGQEQRQAALSAFAARPGPLAPTPDELVRLDEHLRKLQVAEVEEAHVRAQLEAFELEHQHFRSFVEQQSLPRLASVPLLRRSSETLIDYLATTHLASTDRRTSRRVIGRIRSYFKYGRLRGVDPNDTDFILQVQGAFYVRRIDELRQQLHAIERTRERGNADRTATEHRNASQAWLHERLHARYASGTSTTYDERYSRSASTFRSFIADYPVLLSTCHSLHSSLHSGYLLDYLVIDEASQLNLPTAALALASCRNVIVVGDLQQLQHITDMAAAAQACPAPQPCFDYATKSALSGTIDRYGADLPRVMLREHYRSDPAIIGFCNAKFYDGKLIPFTRGSDPAPLVVHRTVEGNHQREHTNIREVEVIEREILPTLRATYADDEIGATTPYRRQVGAIDEFISAIEGVGSLEVDTVHKYQGREKDVMIMSTVLSETRKGREGIRFVDDPNLVNVAVSRAAKKFILVTNHDLLPRSRNLRDLISYIDYHNLGTGPVESDLVSMFDLLYREYSVKLRPLADRLRGEMRYRSEDIVWTVLCELLAEPEYSDLKVVPQVLLRNEFKNLTRLTDAQATYVKNRSSFDFVVYFGVGKRPAFAIEVDGYWFHQGGSDQARRDALKSEICQTMGLPLLRLPTDRSLSDRLLRDWLDRALSVGGEPGDLRP